MGSLNKKILAAGALAALTLGGLTAFAGERGPREGHGHHERGGQPMMMLLRAAELTDAQKAEAKEVFGELRELRGERVDRQERFESLLAALEGPEADADAVHAMIDRQLDEQRAKMHQSADLMLEFWDSLEPDQKTRALETARERAAEGLERQEGGGHPFRGEGI
jgi:hypothetical protein